MKYVITIEKYGTMEIEADDEDQAYDLAVAMEAEGWFYMDMDVQVSPIKENDDA